MVDAVQQGEAFRLKAHIQRGDSAPWWKQGRYKFVFDPIGGRYIVLGFFGSGYEASVQARFRVVHDHDGFGHDEKVSFFCVCSDTGDDRTPNVERDFPKLKFLWDPDATLNQAYGIGPNGVWIVLDPMLRVIEVISFSADRADLRQLINLLARLPPPSLYLGFEIPAPILVLPNVFESEFCRHLIGCYETHGGRESGFMQEVHGRAVEMYDASWKRRKDYLITDESLIELIKQRMARRVGLMIQKAFHFKFSRMERHLVACYAAEDGGHFGPHRDDTVKASEHRRFAASINLNDDFDGGEISFPEFGARQFKAPLGAAVIFSSSVLHRVSRITRGRRYAFLPFLHDEDAERIRQANLRFLST
jgi:predicted 2-oxoglutarate/Fe(II)-dependent dioxygenase YbiX